MNQAKHVWFEVTWLIALVSLSTLGAILGSSREQAGKIEAFLAISLATKATSESSRKTGQNCLKCSSN